MFAIANNSAEKNVFPRGEKRARNVRWENWLQCTDCSTLFAIVFDLKSFVWPRFRFSTKNGHFHENRTLLQQQIIRCEPNSNDRDQKSRLKLVKILCWRYLHTQWALKLAQSSNQHPLCFKWEHHMRLEWIIIFFALVWIQPTKTFSDFVGFGRILRIKFLI